MFSLTVRLPVFFRVNGSLSSSAKFVPPRELQGSMLNLSRDTIPNSRNRQYSMKRPELEDFQGIFSQQSDVDFEDFVKQNPMKKKEYIENQAVSEIPIEEIKKWRKSESMDILGTGCPRPIMEFDHTPYSVDVRRYLKSQFQKPSAIQMQGWPLALSGRDMIASAQTGSGKTLAFLLPALEHAKNVMESGSYDQVSPLVIILAPTRELAVQIHQEALKLLGKYKMHASCVYGGVGNRQQQSQSLFRCPQMVIATPGRLMDFVSCGAISISNVSFVVLDEADRMLDMGFEPQVTSVMRNIRPDRQTLMWSATWPKRVQDLAKTFLNNPVRIRIGSDEISANKDVEQTFLFCLAEERVGRLLNLIREHPNKKILIFSKTKYEVDILAEKLYISHIKAMGIHGDKTQHTRTHIIDSFKNGQCRILVATDVAARGLDISDIDLVVNYSMPACSEDYIHRIGRTGRAGKKGVSITFFTKGDIPMAKEMIKILEESSQKVPPELLKLSTREALSYASGKSSGAIRRANPVKRFSTYQSDVQRELDLKKVPKYDQNSHPATRKVTSFNIPERMSGYAPYDPEDRSFTLGPRQPRHNAKDDSW